MKVPTSMKKNVLQGTSGLISLVFINVQNLLEIYNYELKLNILSA